VSGSEAGLCCTEDILGEAYPRIKTPCLVRLLSRGAIEVFLDAMHRTPLKRLPWVNHPLMPPNFNIAPRAQTRNTLFRSFSLLCAISYHGF
jgi:hypothetical protein